MPHHRRAHDDKHSYAPASRFLDDAALATLDVREDVSRTAAAPALVGAGRIALPDPTAAWT